MGQWSLLGGVERALAVVDDDRRLRRDVLEHIRRTIPFTAFTWVLTDPDTTVGTAPVSGLSPRESAVLTGVADDANLSSIAGLLGITENTVHGHLKSIFDKTGVHSRRELIARARGE